MEQVEEWVGLTGHAPGVSQVKENSQGLASSPPDWNFGPDCREHTFPPGKEESQQSYNIMYVYTGQGFFYKGEGGFGMSVIHDKHTTQLCRILFKNLGSLSL